VYENGHANDSAWGRQFWKVPVGLHDKMF